MADFAALVVQLELQQAEFLKGMEQASAAIERTAATAKKSESGLNDMQAGFDKIVGRIRKVGEAFGAWKAVEAIAIAGEKIGILTAQFDALFGSSERAADMMDRIEEVAARTHISADQVAADMRRMSIAMVDLGANNGQIATLTEAIIQLGAIGGSSSEQTAATVSRVAQALQLGTVNARQFKEMLQDSPALVRQVADGLGVSTQQLAKMAAAGQLTGTMLANSLIKNADKIQEKFSALPVTVTAGIAAMGNGWDNFLSKVDKVSALSTELGVTFTYIGGIFQRWAKELDDPAQKFELMQLGARAIGTVFETLAVLCANIAFICEAIARDLVSAASAAALILSGDFTGAGKVWDAMNKADADARAALDAYEKKLLGVGTTAEQTGKKVADALKGGAGGGAGAGGKSATDAETDRLKRLADQLNSMVDPVYVHTKAMKELQEVYDAGLISKNNFDRANQKFFDDMTAAGDAIRAAVDPVFAYTKEIDKLNDALKAGIITQDIHRLSVDKARKEMEKKTGAFDWAKGIEDTVKSAATAMGDFFGSIISGSADAGEAFKKMAESIISAIAKMVAEAAAAWIVKSLFGGSGAGGAAAGGQSAGALSWAPATMLAPIGPSTFAGELEAGGGAAVVPQSPFSVVVNNYAPGVDVSTRTGTAGELEITVERVRAALTNDVMKGGNRFASALERTYAVARGR